MGHPDTITTLGSLVVMEVDGSRKLGPLQSSMTKSRRSAEEQSGNEVLLS